MKSQYMKPKTQFFISTRANGFSLIELMVSIAIIGILLAVGATSFKNYVTNEDVRTIAHQFQSSLLLARSEAVKRSTNTYLTPSSNGYKEGWIVSTMQGRAYNSCLSPTPPTDCIYVFQNDRPITLAGISGQIEYNRQGRIPLGTSFSIEICDSENSEFISKRTVDVNSNGFPKIQVEGDCGP